MEKKVHLFKKISKKKKQNNISISAERIFSPVSKICLFKEYWDLFGPRPQGTLSLDKSDQYKREELIIFRTQITGFKYV